jgi:uncharacterized protein YbjT (DUF2867 family)
MTRDPARVKDSAGAQWVRGDLEDSASLASAMASVDTVFLLAPPGQHQARHDLALLRAAGDAGVGRLVKLSAIGTGLASHPTMGQWHQPGEDAVRARGLAWTILRPTSFASNTRIWAPAIRSGDAVPNPFGAGEQGVVDPRDVATVAVVTLTEAGHSGQTYTLTGPSLLSTPAQVELIGAALGRPTRTAELSLADWRAQLTASGADPAYIEKIVEGVTFVRDGYNAVVTNDVERVTGRAARDFPTWVLDHRADFD